VSSTSSSESVPGRLPFAGAALVAAAGAFHVAWVLMPGVGITDTHEIFRRVAANGDAVRASVVLQLVSAACYAPAALGLVRRLRGRLASAGAALLLIGAMGSAADAVLHLLAVEMVAPGVDRAAMVPVMERMQGPDLRLLAPMFAAFFTGSLALAAAAARQALVSRGNPLLFAAGVGCAVTAACVHTASPGASRCLALAFLGFVAVSQAWLGVMLCRAGRR